MKIEVDKDDLELVMMCAMRYAYGRRTYVVETIQDFVLKHCDESLIDKFVKDVENYLKDYKTWYSPSQSVLQSWESFIIRLNEKKNHE